MNEIKFGIGSVPVKVAAKAYGRDASWVRAGLIAGWLPIGEATRYGRKITSIEQMNSKYGRINYYISRNSCTNRPDLYGRGKHEA